MTQPNREKLEELAKILDEVPEGEYDQGHYVHQNVNSCNTPACALGWWAFKHPETWALVDDVEPRLISKPNADSAFKSAMVEFGLSLSLAEELFGPFGMGKAIIVRAEDSFTSKDAAAYVRDFISRNCPTVSPPSSPAHPNKGNFKNNPQRAKEAGRKGGLRGRE